VTGAVARGSIPHSSFPHDAFLLLSGSSLLFAHLRAPQKLRRGGGVGELEEEGQCARAQRPAAQGMADEGTGRHASSQAGKAFCANVCRALPLGAQCRPVRRCPGWPSSRSWPLECTAVLVIGCMPIPAIHGRRRSPVRVCDRLCYNHHHHALPASYGLRGFLIGRPRISSRSWAPFYAPCSI